MAQSSLLQTIVTDLKAGESWLENEALGIGLFLWNNLKSAFIALGPEAAQIAMDVLTGAVKAAEAGHSAEQIFTSALNTATAEGKQALVTLGSKTGQQIILGIQQNLEATTLPPPTAN